MLQVREAEVAVAKNLLDHLVQEGAHLVAVGEEDVRMEGKLRLLLELVQALDCRVVGNCSHGSLVHRTIVGTLIAVLNMISIKQESMTCCSTKV